MSTTKRRSTFFGPQRAIKAYYPEYNIILQLYNLQPGEFWNPAHEANLLTPHTLPGHPLATEAFFVLNDGNYQWQFRHGPTRSWISVHSLGYFTKKVFYLRLRFGIHQFAYDSNKTPAGLVAYGGSATVKWLEV